jgi:diguanylate cyclase (GGDEF)-like protein
MLTRLAWSRRTLSGGCRVESGEEHYPIERAGVWADCIRERKPVVHNDYASLTNRRGLPPGHFAIERELAAPTLRDGKVVAILGVGNKADDYTEEDVSLVSFVADIVWSLVLQKRSEERILELNRDLERLAMTDELTGIANRRAFFAFADRELKKARRYSEPVSFLMMDIDHFKLVNDRYGHDAGDAALKTVALIVQNHVRGVDVAARLGGEEFGILMPNTALADAAKSADRLRATVAEASCDFKDVSLSMTISVGVASLGGSATDLDSIMKAADEALYRAKAAGRNRVETA